LALPKLTLLITTGARNLSIDMAAAAERGITVCGTSSFGNPTTRIEPSFWICWRHKRRSRWRTPVCTAISRSVRRRLDA
jgi:hypothetical protein